jgi:CelD/BcsL family acetyltransferase involved in cellulose biosynthesis
LLKREIGTGRATQQSVQSPEDFERGYAVLIDLHQKRRLMLGTPGCFASERYLNFHREFAQRMLAQHRLRLAWIEIEGRPAAVEYDFLGEQTIYNYQSGLEPELFDEQPGWLNLVCTLQWAMAHGYRTFDMLRGDEPYKASFGAKPAPLMQVRVVGHHASARLRHAAWRTQAVVKRWARTSLDRAAQWRKAAPVTASTNTGTEEDAD